MKSKIFKIISAFVLAAAMIAAAISCSDNKVYKKTFPSISEIEYDPDLYIKLPVLSDITVSKKEVDERVDYALMSLLLQDAEYTLYSEAGSAEASLYDTVNISFVGAPDDGKTVLDDNTLEMLCKTSVNLVIGAGDIYKLFSDKIMDSPDDAADFERELIGLSVGDSKNIILTLPGDCQISALRGLNVRFTVSLNTVNRPDADVGSLTDDTVLQKTGYPTVNEYRNYLVEYYLGDLAYNAVVEKCEIIDDCKEIFDVYVDKYIHELILQSYGDELTEKEYNKAYDEVMKSSKDKAYAWATPVSRERLILNSLFELCEIKLSDKQYKTLLEADWNENKEKYKQTAGVESAKELEDYFGKDELMLAYCFDELLRVLPGKITVA
ncbi:MAG: hypothetical protein IJZ03_02715 [Clostridia bacterium]|nr:hypothetical protein [Clostridia bacterium]